jgi:hypothetical protein
MQALDSRGYNTEWHHTAVKGFPKQCMPCQSVRCFVTKGIAPQAMQQATPDVLLMMTCVR